MNYQKYDKGELINYAKKILKEKAKIDADDDIIISVLPKCELKEKLISNIKNDIYIDEIEFEDFPRLILSSFGYIPKNAYSFGIISPILSKYKHLTDNQLSIAKDFAIFLNEQVNSKVIMLDLSKYIEHIISNYSLEDLEIGFDIAYNFSNQYISSPLYHHSKYNNIDSISLKQLYTLEKINSKIGDFFDKRYIDFLKANINQIDKIHWRKFEQLSAQFFYDNGYDVEIGKGRKDGGKDVIAKKGNDLIIIQCKKEKNNIGVGVIKELYADILFYNASKGIVFCPKDLTKDSKTLIDDRKYNISVFNRDDILKELNKY